MPSNYARTLRQVINDSFRLINDYRGNGKDGKHFSWLEARTMAQDVLLNMVRRTGILRESRIIFLQTDMQTYSLPDDCIRILRVGINRARGSVVLPTSITERDYQSFARSSEGEPVEFWRDHTLAMNQIGFIPTPNQAGSSFTRDSDYGLLRRIVDEDGNALPFDANTGGLRTIQGVPLHVSGNARIIREVISLYGNIQVAYVRAPEKWTDPDGYPDSDIPDFIHKDIKYGLGSTLCTYSRQRIHQFKKVRFAAKWESVVGKLQRHCETTGPLDEAKPL